MIAAIRRDDEVHVPGADDTMKAKDVVLVIGPREVRDRLVKLFGTK